MNFPTIPPKSHYDKIIFYPKTLFKYKKKFCMSPAARDELKTFLNVSTQNLLLFVTESVGWLVGWCDTEINLKIKMK